MNLRGEFKWYLGSGKDYARLGFTESNNAFSIDIVLVPKSARRNGIGTALISHVLAMAEVLQKDVYLTARPIAGQASPEKQEQLVNYYRKFGFQVIDHGVTATYMVKKKNMMTGVELTD